MHCDAVQSVGKVELNFRELGVSTLAFSGHKFHGPRGVGGLLVRHDVNLSPLLVGGSQQLGLRPGTESVVTVVGMEVALKLMLSLEPNWITRVRPLRDRLEQQLVQACNCVVVGAEPRMPHTTSVAFPGIDRQALVMALDLNGVECSTGSACTSGSSEPSHVLVATGVGLELINSSIRLSLSTTSTEAEIDLAIERISAVFGRLKTS